MKAVTLFGKMLTFSRLKLTTDDLTLIKAELEALLTKKGHSIPVVIDSTVTLELSALVDMLWSLGIQPIGVVEGELTEQANQLRLATFPADGKRIERIEPSQHTPVAKMADATVATSTNTATQTLSTAIEPLQRAQSPTQGVSSVVHSQMLRSGQSVQHLGGDLIIVGGVNNGAEAITDNSLHIYGHGQGRLVAGATGDKDARIFCQKFNPSLVSVAGTYCLREDIPADMVDKAVQVSYDENVGLVFTLMAH